MIISVAFPKVAFKRPPTAGRKMISEVNEYAAYNTKLNNLTKNTANKSRVPVGPV